MNELLDDFREIDPSEKRWLYAIVSKIQSYLGNVDNFHSDDSFAELLTSNFSSLDVIDSQTFNQFCSLMVRLSLAAMPTWGYYPRTTQILAVVILLRGFFKARWGSIRTREMKGLLIQMATGEGKSVVVAMFAASLCLLAQQRVDIVTSADALAQRDAEESRPYFRSLGLTVAHSDVGDISSDLIFETQFFLQEHSSYCFFTEHLHAWCRSLEQGALPKSMEHPSNRRLYEGSIDEVHAAWRDQFPQIERKPRPKAEELGRDDYAPNPCYQANVVYGTAMSLQGDLLRHELKAMGTRDVTPGVMRPLDVVICDECDSLQASPCVSRTAGILSRVEFFLQVVSWAEFSISFLFLGRSCRYVACFLGGVVGLFLVSSVDSDLLFYATLRGVGL